MEKVITHKVLSWEEQEASFMSVQDLESYLLMCEQFFTDRSVNIWPNRVRDELKDTRFKFTEGDYFRFIGLVAILFAQFGFPSLEGQLNRHDKYQWKRSVLSPKHQLALACYAGNLNVQSYPHKRAQFEDLEKIDPVISLGVWGISMPVTGGRVNLEPLSQERRFEQARKRFEDDKRLICLPNLELNQSLSALEFSGDQADSMTEKEFDEQILPSVIEMFDPYFNADIVFHKHRRLRRFR